jgi:transposase
MIPLPAGVRVWLATGYTDMRKGFPSLALQVQEILHRDPLCGHLFCFRRRRGNLLKVIWHDVLISTGSAREMLHLKDGNIKIGVIQ